MTKLKNIFILIFILISSVTAFGSESIKVKS